MTTGENHRDLWLRSEGASLEEAFAGLSHELVREVCPPVVNEGGLKQPLDLLCHGADKESLLLSWIETLLYVLDVRHVLLSDFEIKISPGFLLSARCMIQPIFTGHLRLPQGLDASTAAVFQGPGGLWKLETRLILPGFAGKI